MTNDRWIMHVDMDAFYAAVEQADVGVGALDDLTVHLQHQAQHAVGGRMLGAEVQGVVADLRHLRRPSAGSRRSGCRRG